MKPQPIKINPPHGPVDERFMRHHYGASGHVSQSPSDTVEKARRYLALPSVDSDSKRIIAALLAELAAERVEAESAFATERQRRERLEQALRRLVACFPHDQMLNDMERDCLKLCISRGVTITQVRDARAALKELEDSRG